MVCDWCDRMQAHFENVQRIADATTLPHAIQYLSSRTAEELDLSQLTEKLIRGKDQPNTLSSSEKLELWNRLKILSMESLFCLFLYYGSHHKIVSDKGNSVVCRFHKNGGFTMGCDND